MNPMIKSVCITTALLSSLLLLSSGCSKKTVIPPEGTPVDGGGMSGGTNINYPSADSSYSESGLAGEESMGSTGGQGIGNLSINSGADQQSEEYKRTYGRSSTVFSPIYFDFDQAGINAE